MNMECVSLKTGGCDCLHPLLRLSDAISSTMLYNVLNFPAGVVPVSTVTEADEEELKLYKGCCDDPWDRTLKQVRGGAETAGGSSGNSFNDIRGS